MEITLDDAELNYNYHARELMRLRRLHDQTTHKANAATEALSRPKPDAGRTIYRAQVVTTAIPVASAGVVGTGSVLLCILIAGTIYRVYPHITISGAVNDTGGTSSIAVNTLVWITQVDGYWSIMHADCGTTSPSAFADQPH